MKSLLNLRSLVLSLCLIALAASQALAVAVMDFSAVTTAVTAEVSPAITAAMPIAGLILACGIGWKLYKRFTK